MPARGPDLRGIDRRIPDLTIPQLHNGPVQELNVREGEKIGFCDPPTPETSQSTASEDSDLIAGDFLTRVDVVAMGGLEPPTPAL